MDLSKLGLLKTSLLCNLEINLNPTEFGFKKKASIWSTIKKIYFYIVVNFPHLLSSSLFNLFLWQVLYHGEIPVAIKAINLTIESPAFSLGNFLGQKQETVSRDNRSQNIWEKL